MSEPDVRTPAPPGFLLRGDAMPIVETIRSEMTAAIKARDTRRRDIMRLLVASLNNARIEAGHELSDEEAIPVLQRESRQRRDSIEEYTKGGRDDLVQAEREELEAIGAFLPAALSDDEVAELARAMIAEMGASGPGDIGKVMGPLMQRLAGRADGRRANALVRELLSSA